jgi:hypothetical protein
MLKETAQQARERITSQFLLQADRMGYTVLARLSGYRLEVLDREEGKRLVVSIVPSSFDYYEYRLHRGKQRFDALVVALHDAVVPVQVIDMHSSLVRSPGDRPALSPRPGARRRTRTEKRLVLSQVILWTDEGMNAVATMPLRMRQRYLREARWYTLGRVGRPFAS